MVISGSAFEHTSLNNIHIHKYNVEADVKSLLSRHTVTGSNHVAAWLLKAISVIDLTTLAGDDTRSNVTRLCIKAANPLSEPTVLGLGLGNENITVRTAAVCVYPSRVKDAHDTLKRLDMLGTIQIAAVATGFPSGLYPLNTRLSEIQFATAQGASEIDVVIDRSLVLTGDWDTLYDELLQMKKACGDAHLKVILGVGELGTLDNVYKASMTAMMAGADFIKTSTGKEAVNATLPIGLVMCRAIRAYYRATGRKVGLKPAGGIKTYQDAINWLILIRTELGTDWLTPELFRIGASSLLGEIEKFLDNYVKTSFQRPRQSEGGSGDVVKDCETVVKRLSQEKGEGESGDVAVVRE